MGFRSICAIAAIQGKGNDFIISDVQIKELPNKYIYWVRYKISFHDNILHNNVTLVYEKSANLKKKETSNFFMFSQRTYFFADAKSYLASIDEILWNSSAHLIDRGGNLFDGVTIFLKSCPNGAFKRLCWTCSFCINYWIYRKG